MKSTYPKNLRGSINESVNKNKIKKQIQLLEKLTNKKARLVENVSEENHPQAAIEDRIIELQKKGLITKQEADNYLEVLGDAWDEEAYEDISDEELISDIKLYNSYE